MPGIVPGKFHSADPNSETDIIVIVDAVDMGSAPGTIRIIPSEYIRDVGIGTHQMSLAYLIDQVSPWSKIYFIGIQPGCLDPDTLLTVPVRSAADYLITIIRSHDFDKVLVLGKEDAKEQD
jgi:hydrogenase maturation protease